MSISRVTLRDLQEVLARLDAERAALSARIADIDSQAEAVRATHGYLTVLYNEAQAEIAASPPPPPSKNLRNEMVTILREANEPVHYKVLRTLLENRGLVINGTNKDNTVGAHLSNDTRFRNVGKGLWALASWGAETDRRGSNDDESDDSEIGQDGEPPDDEGESEDESPPSPVTRDANTTLAPKVLYTADLLKVGNPQPQQMIRPGV